MEQLQLDEDADGDGLIDADEGEEASATRTVMTTES